MEIDLNEFLPYQLNQLATKISDDFASVYQQKYNLTISQWRIVANLAQFGQSNARELCSLANMDKSTVSRAIKALIDQGYLVTQLSEQDKRATDVMLNQRGKELYQRIAQDAYIWQRQLAANFSKDEQEQLLSLLIKLKTSFK
ncbi:transcriptional regulator [Pseudoalteromonas sp. MM1]|jgi:DNA-binding MarR family transcriptional regulator|uniref:MarR family winged helix-turn-helix transcriptional regulator n=1 Tax=Pseudoalteromonas sp. MM1 TaxID=3036714 RepID=UPI002573D083|nr:MarR family transcriptional regulator [Pseudoalteromonas sp. MM1]BED91081.1 transcriptional regulator [Pseudoalteromonas sp. MM1]